MLTILTSRQEAKDLAEQIHKWRQDNIKGYNATSWANENLPDKEYDKLYKHQKEELWQVPLAHDDKGAVIMKEAQIDVLPEGCRAEATGMD